MLDDLRNSSSFIEEEPPVEEEPQPKRFTQRKKETFLGMTAQQRFIIAFMMMIAVCVLGVMLLLITGRFGLF
ncbi:MAG: hypothetical protein HGA26_05135 [Chlorobiaceae bacterium]|nr:hypothetical protein [Chlorobiaceae bacterium]